MSRLSIKENEQTEAVPYLRGILTSSLRDAGLNFADAYQLASDIRDEIGDENGKIITSNALREMVAARLKKEYGNEIVRRYSHNDLLPEPVWVQLSENHSVPFSRAYHQQCLESCCFSNHKAETITTQVYEYLLKNTINKISADELRQLTHNHLLDNFGKSAAKRYLIWVSFVRSTRPLIVLIGGVSGCGKSSIATELAHHLGIVRIQSTDMLREVMRMMTPKRLIPSLHSSSFSAWKTLPNDDTDIHEGYIAQSELLHLSCEAIIQRALKERVSLIIEGIHLNPALLERFPQDNDAIFIPIMLGVLKPNQLRGRFQSRGRTAPERHSARYLKHFDDIWRLQSFLLSTADQYNVPIVPNANKEKAINNIMKIVIDKLDDNFSKKELLLPSLISKTS